MREGDREHRGEIKLVNAAKVRRREDRKLRKREGGRRERASGERREEGKTVGKREQGQVSGTGNKERGKVR